MPETRQNTASYLSAALLDHVIHANRIIIIIIIITSIAAVAAAESDAVHVLSFRGQ